MTVGCKFGLVLTCRDNKTIACKSKKTKTLTLSLSRRTGRGEKREDAIVQRDTFYWLRVS